MLLLLLLLLLRAACSRLRRIIKRLTDTIHDVVGYTMLGCIACCWSCIKYYNNRHSSSHAIRESGVAEHGVSGSGSFPIITMLCVSLRITTYWENAMHDHIVAAGPGRRRFFGDRDRRCGQFNSFCGSHHGAGGSCTVSGDFDDGVDLHVCGRWGMSDGNVRSTAGSWRA